jgi:16S rRNA (guanine(966)-N(2))-methyltransferase RsmD
MGIEALSRGAEQVVFVESNPAAAALIQANLSHCRLEEAGCVRVMDALRYLENFRQSGQGAFDLIFCDPPYGRQDQGGLPALIARNDILKPGGILILEGMRSLELGECPAALTLFKTRVYGKTGVFYFKLET